MSSEIVYDLGHETGEPCAVVDLLLDSLGEQEGGYLLWNLTCFPYSDSHAWEQAKALVRADCAGRLAEFVREADERDERAMREVARSAS